MEPKPQPIQAWKQRLAFLQEQEAVVSDPAQKFTLLKQIKEAQAKLRELTGNTEPGPGLHLDLGRLPIPGPHFVGRDAELARLDAAWEDPRIHVLTLVAFGGVGKSALVARWMDRMAADNWRGAARVLDWSFYSQGMEDRVTSAEPFGAAADLTEVLEIAERGPMRLHECDARLEWARLCRDQGDLAAARRHVARARELVNETGYGRRKREVRWLEGSLGGG